MDPDAIALGVLWYVVFLLSTTCHEAAHALAASRGGDRTAEHGGQVSLSPVPHVRREPFGMVLVPWLSFFLSGWMMGWASAPYDPFWAHRHPRKAAAMALAGPGANFSLAILAAILIRGGLATGFFDFPEYIRFSHIVGASAGGFAEAAATILSILFTLNIILGAFNLMPVPPLDGWSALGLFLPEETTRRMTAWASRLGGMAMLGLVVAWQLFDRIYGPIFEFSLTMLYSLGR